MENLISSIAMGLFLLLGILVVTIIVWFNFFNNSQSKSAHQQDSDESNHNNKRTLPQNSDESSHNNKGTLPQDILDAISKCLKDSPKELASVMILLLNNKDTTNYFQILRSVMTNDLAFREILLNRVKNSEEHKLNPEFQQVMADISNNCLEPSAKKNEYGQSINVLALSLRAKELGAVTTFNFVQALSSIPFSAQAEMIQIATKAAEAVCGSSMASVIRQSGESALVLARSTSGQLVPVTLLAGHLVYEAYQSLRRWWNGEITGVRCAKIIVDSCVSVTAGVGGGLAGATIIGAFSPGIIAVIGAVLGGMVSSALANSLSDWATQKIFNLPKKEALEEAYRFLGVPYGASNNEINSSYKKLALKYHSDKGGKNEDWHKLQVCMALIKVSSGEV